MKAAREGENFFCKKVFPLSRSPLFKKLQPREGWSFFKKKALGFSERFLLSYILRFTLSKATKALFGKVLLGVGREFERGAGTFSFKKTSRPSLKVYSFPHTSESAGKIMAPTVLPAMTSHKKPNACKEKMPLTAK